MRVAQLLSNACSDSWHRPRDGCRIVVNDNKCFKDVLISTNGDGFTKMLKWFSRVAKSSGVRTFNIQIG